MIKLSYVTKNTSILNSGLHQTDIDFSNFSPLEENDFFEIDINDIIVRYFLPNNMTSDVFVEWLAVNLNINADFNDIATASSNNNVLSITSKTIDELNINYDFNR